ncbi:DNA-directed RNA polymerase subunit beta [Desulforegula conservatrix]|uniref:DNA-directed RNA polymerase subunit beta n=1 Tax=Desulforegula conservatrix TaxID=153026 RepID=UPI000401D363|nr:DNA-directed RNA polymerase subunit beta [Desulforegula conservatrix]
MTASPLANRRLRKNFGSMHKIVDIPDLIGMQRESYERFLQMNVQPDNRTETGLQAVFKSVFPIKDFTGSASLEFVSYSFAETKHSEKECIHRGMTYEIPIRIRVRLVVFDVDKDRGISSIRDIKEQEIYFGTIPLMTRRGTFIINGTERVIVSQLHRSSGVFFDRDKAKTHSSGKVVYTARIIPVRGSWIDMEIDHKDVVYIRIDRRRKFPVTTLFKAFGYSVEDILNYFYIKERIVVKEGSYFKTFDETNLKGQRSSFDVKDPATGEIIVKKGRAFTKRAIRQLKASGMKHVPIHIDDLLSKSFAGKVLFPETGEVFAEAGDVIDEKIVENLAEAGISEFDIIYVDAAFSADCIRKTLAADKLPRREDALVDIYRRLRPGNPATPEVAQNSLDDHFFKSSYYDLSGVGRLKMNHRLGIDTKIDIHTLRKEDILLTAKTLIDLRDTQGAVDDIDHLGNRRVRAVGELLENQYRIGLVRMERAIKERMSMQEVDALMPHDLVNPKPVSAVVKEFFGTSQLSQFMDQTNPLSETTHKRRLSALGPGGLTRERAGFEVRDVHPSHYGRICPIETPEGPNIGLIVSLCTYAKVNDFGFIETPYRVVKEGQVSKEVRMLSAFEEKKSPIAQANVPVDENGKFAVPLITARVEGEYQMVLQEDVELMDISPNQLVSVSASLIPFLENDDANRALMGSNMQRQAVPLMQCAAPLVGTGIEHVVAKDSGVTVVADRDAVIAEIDASRIVLLHESEGTNSDNAVTIHNLNKFTRSNQNTCFNHRPIVKKGQRVSAGEIIADGPSTDKGELALGKNVTVAFMPWGGYNFEDSILVSERLVRDGVFTSVHIEEFETVARDTKLGKEEITRDIPNVGEEALKDLDESGIIRLGADVKPGDILVGKITPKGETQLSPEEKLLRAIFGEKAGDVKDTSLRVPPGIEGVVIDVKVFSRRGVDKDDRTRYIEDSEIAALEKDREDKIRLIENMAKKQIIDMASGKVCTAPVRRGKNVILNSGSVIQHEDLADASISALESIVLEDSELTERIHSILASCRKHTDKCRREFEEQVSRYEKGDDLPPGVIKMIKVYVAMKRVLSVGDKMAGRHGNKGVVSRILPVEDLPYFEDGTTVDMVLNPLGVPSRMNVGQILEIHLGRAAKCLGDQINAMVEEKKYQELREKYKRIFPEQNVDAEIDALTESELVQFSKLYKNGVCTATPVFDGASEEKIKDLLTEAGVSTTGQAVLYDGRTGDRFDGPITVGTMYILKLHHLVDDKLHARSIGPYSLVTQQPLGGKAQFGGQRLGEMEVWAMEAYGSAHALQEFITVKSDDMAGRTRMYEKIVKGQNVLEPGLPESFRVLIKELQALGLDINLIEGKV